MKFLKTTLPLFLLLLFLSSCTEEPKDTFNPKLLIGKWELTEAFSNDKKTERLNGAYLEFKADGTMKTNILGVEEEGTYQLEEKKVTQQTAKTVNYLIEKLDTDSLLMHMHMAQFNFKLSMKRAKVS